MLVAQGFPNGGVTLEARAESDLPHDVTFPYPVFGFHVRQDVPDSAGRRVAPLV